MVLLLVGCSAGSSPNKATGLTFAPCGPLVDVTPVPAERLAMLEVTCGTLNVPVDHNKPDGKTLPVRVVRAHAKKQSNRIGSLVLNPGGPAQSGLDYFPSWISLFSKDLLSRFDVVTFDPRGTGQSAPINCGKTPDEDEVETLPDLSSSEGYLHVQTSLKQLTDVCLAKLGDSAPHYSTDATAKDLDLLRAQLGDEKLTYVGFSYGAKLGGEYARQFPNKVRALVLDAPSDPTVTALALAERQVAGFELGLKQWAANCPKRPTCQGLGDPIRYVTDLAARARATPIPSGRRGDDQPATDVTVLRGVIALLYDDAAWTHLDEALRDADAGDSGGLFEAHETLNGGEKGDGDPPSEVDLSQASFVINCNDTAPGPTEAEAKTSAARLISRYPVFGRYGASSLTLCQQWQPDRHPIVVQSAATPPLLVIGTIHDPATPYAGAVAFAEALGAATLLTWEGDGHTAFLRSGCINEKVQDYLLTLTAPPTGTRCPA